MPRGQAPEGYTDPASGRKPESVCEDMETKAGMIGVLGGVGPYAGLDLMRKLFDATQACCDQEHLPVVAFSLPGQIADRTRFLLGETDANPGEAIGAIMVRLAAAGASVIGMPCNTAHSPRILEPALRRLRAAAPETRFVHLIDVTVAAVSRLVCTDKKAPAGVRVGVLSTRGTHAAGIYQDALERAGLVPLFPDEAGRDRVQAAISDPGFGIKARSSPVSEKARQWLAAEADRLVEQGARAVILGCTEIPLALTENVRHGVPLVDATAALARALVCAFAPEKLRPENRFCGTAGKERPCPA